MSASVLHTVVPATCVIIILSFVAASASASNLNEYRGHSKGSRQLLQNPAAQVAMGLPRPVIPRGGKCNPGFAGGVMGDCAAGLKCKFEDPLPYFDAPGVCVDKPAEIVVGEGSSCGGFRVTPVVCDKGLTCDYSKNPPNVADAPGICKKVPPKEAGEGEVCGGYSFVTRDPKPCSKGLKCDFSKNPPNVTDLPGICVKSGPPALALIKKGGICGGFVGAQCEAGLTCDRNAIGVGSSAGICVDSSCTKCNNTRRQVPETVCGTNPVTNQRKSYPSRCYAKCLNATNITDGSCRY